MAKDLMRATFCLVTLCCLPLVASAQSARQDIPDLAGVWQRSFPGDSSLVPEPPLTVWGQERFDLAKPIHGPRTTSATEANSAELACLPMGEQAVDLALNLEAFALFNVESSADDDRPRL